jgi:hypothetical protein
LPTTAEINARLSAIDREIGCLKAERGQLNRLLKDYAKHGEPPAGPGGNPGDQTDDTDGPAPAASVYGYCPQCGAPSVNRERRPCGNDECANGHVYPSITATVVPMATHDPGAEMIRRLNAYELRAEAVGGHIEVRGAPDAAEEATFDHHPDTAKPKGDRR